LAECRGAISMHLYYEGTQFKSQPDTGYPERV